MCGRSFVVIMSKRQMLLDWINSTPGTLETFQEGWGRDTVEEYLDEYSHEDHIESRLAGDLGAPPELVEKLYFN
jgi:hypothetical protein